MICGGCGRETPLDNVAHSWALRTAEKGVLCRDCATASPLLIEDIEGFVGPTLVKPQEIEAAHDEAILADEFGVCRRDDNVVIGHVGSVRGMGACPSCGKHAIWPEHRCDGKPA